MKKEQVRERNAMQNANMADVEAFAAVIKFHAITTITPFLSFRKRMKKEKSVFVSNPTCKYT